MGGSRAGRCRGRRGIARDGGTAVIEFAVVAPLLFALVFGIIDFGSTYNDWISVRQGTRDATRQAVTGRIGSDTSCSISGSTPTNSNVTRLVCLTKDRVGLDPPLDTRVKIDVEGNYADKRSIAICVMRSADSVTGFYGVLLDDRVFTTEVQMRIEQTVQEAGGTGVLEDYAEPALAGENWGFCAAGAT